MSKLSLLAPFAGLALAFHSSAQVQWGGHQDPLLPFLPDNRIAWPFGGNPQFGRTLILELDGDQAPDGVVIADGNAYVLWQPNYYDWVAPITFPSAAAPSNVRDIVVLPVGDDTVADALLMTDARGLYKTSWSGTNFTNPVILATGRWVNAGPFRLADVSGDGILDLVGRAGDGLAAVTRIGNSSGGFAVGQTLVPPGGAAVLDAIAVQWDGTGGREVAVLCTDGLHVFSQAGTRLEFKAHVQTTGAIAAFKASAAGDELLAWTRPTVSGTANELLVLGSGVNEPAQALFFDEVNGLDPFWNGSLLAGDYYNGGGDELLLVHQNKAFAAVLYNSGVSGAHFDSSDDAYHDLVRLSLTGSVTGAGIPAFADLDIDTPDDLLVPVEGTNEILAFCTLPYFRSNLQVAPPNSADVFMANCEYSQPNYGQFRMAIRIPDSAYYQQFTHVNLKLWYASGPATNAQGDGAGHWEGPLSGPGQPFQWTPLDKNFPQSAGGMTLCWPFPNQHHYYLELRFYKVVSGVRSWSPKFFGGFTLQNDCVDYQNTAYKNYLTFVGLPGTQFDLLPKNKLTGGSGSGQTFVGSFVPMSSAPTFSTPPVPSEVGTFLNSPLQPFSPF